MAVISGNASADLSDFTRGFGADQSPSPLPRKRPSSAAADGFATNSPIGRGSRQLALLWREGWRVANPFLPSDFVQHAGLPPHWRGRGPRSPPRQNAAN